jgi:hypothetical protein
MADNEKEVVIKITAKNLTADEFAKARKQLAGLGDEADAQNKKTKTWMASLKQWGGAAGESLKVVGMGLGVVAAGVGAVTAAVVALGQRGAGIKDLRDQFDILNRAIGLDSAKALGTLDKAMDGTVTRTELLRITNQALSQA